MNIQPAQHVRADDPDRPPCLCHDLTDCPEQATEEINAAQLAHVAELLDLIDGFLRSGNGIADHLTDYLQTTARDPRTTPPPGAPTTTRTWSSTSSASPLTPCAGGHPE
jgi:hypothetical protein